MGQIVSDVTSVLDNRNEKKEATKQKNQIIEQIQKDEIEKVNLVNKVLATQRAKSGASGVASNSLTSEAVLERLREETEKPFDDKKQSNLEKIKNIKTSKTNLLGSLLSRIDELLG